MKKHLTPESSYIPSAAAQETCMDSYLCGPISRASLVMARQGGYVCQGAMTKLWLLFQGWGEERVIGEKGVGWPYHTKSMHNNNQVRALRKLAGMQQNPETLSDYKNKNEDLKWVRIEMKANTKKRKKDFAYVPIV